MSDWTVATLKEHIERLRESDKAAVSAALAAAQLAVDTAERNAEKWRDSANEWRGAMDDREARFVGRPENDAVIGALSERLRAMENWRAKAMGAAAVMMLLAGLVGAAIMDAFGK